MLYFYSFIAHFKIAIANLLRFYESEKGILLSVIIVITDNIVIIGNWVFLKN
jgi:hypothetical protein